jgi:hypothetical protein
MRFSTGTSNVHSLLHFDLSSIPAGSTITGASLRVRVNSGGTGHGTHTLLFKRLIVSWIEGTKGGVAADAGEPTWNNREHPATAWGGVGASGAADLQQDNGTDKVLWSTLMGTGATTPYNWADIFANLNGSYTIADVIAAIQETIDDFGGHLNLHLDVESGGVNMVLMHRWASRHDATADNRPLLEVTYTPPASGTGERRSNMSLAMGIRI